MKLGNIFSAAALAVVGVATVVVTKHHQPLEVPAAAVTPVVPQPELLIDQTHPPAANRGEHSAEMGEIMAAVQRQTLRNDAVRVEGPILGHFVAGIAQNQELFAASQEGEDRHHPNGFLAIFTGGKLRLVINDYGSATVVRALRLKDADVDYVLEGTEDGGQGFEYFNDRVVSLRDPEAPRIVADLGNTKIEECASGEPKARVLAGKVYYKASGTALDIQPIEYYAASCETPDQFALVATSRDDIDKVLSQLKAKDPKPTTISEPVPDAQSVSQERLPCDNLALAHQPTPADRDEAAREEMNNILKVTGKPTLMFAAEGNDKRTFDVAVGAANRAFLDLYMKAQRQTPVTRAWLCVEGFTSMKYVEIQGDGSIPDDYQTVAIVPITSDVLADPKLHAAMGLDRK